MGQVLSLKTYLYTAEMGSAMSTLQKIGDACSRQIERDLALMGLLAGRGIPVGDSAANELAAALSNLEFLSKPNVIANAAMAARNRMIQRAQTRASDLERNCIDMIKQREGIKEDAQAYSFFQV